MQRSAVRATVGGVAVDVPFGTFAAADLMQYDGPSRTFKGASLASLGIASSPDTAPPAPSALDDEFPNGALNGKWSLWNPGGGLTAAIWNNQLYLEPGVTSAFQGIYQAVPATDYTVYSKVAVIDDGDPVSGTDRVGLFVAADIAGSPTTADFWNVGLAAYSMTAGLLHTTDSAIVEVSKWNDYLNVNSHEFSAGHGSASHVYVRIRKISTDYYFEISSDGFGWRIVDHAGALGFTPSYFGIYGYSFNGGARLLADFFRVYAGAGKGAKYATTING